MLPSPAIPTWFDIVLRTLSSFLTPASLISPKYPPSLSLLLATNHAYFRRDSSSEIPAAPPASSPAAPIPSSAPAPKPSSPCSQLIPASSYLVSSHRPIFPRSWFVFPVVRSSLPLVVSSTDDPTLVPDLIIYRSISDHTSFVFSHLNLKDLNYHTNLDHLISNLDHYYIITTLDLDHNYLVVPHHDLRPRPPRHRPHTLRRHRKRPRQRRNQPRPRLERLQPPTATLLHRLPIPKSNDPGILDGTTINWSFSGFFL
ncbi:hypothetical protein DFH94DRAFT_700279 [Russula ochroleuca]|jgi:hypothetical protein|uniref:Uncharacterized protein n=1 Tax=Russula ochroleuca TaxID=152965 RepID=A0A9P5JU69_9AGAM|nr:hypothetical protein DFH94DRAFT_700279 [Russula ochroleuca]